MNDATPPPSCRLKGDNSISRLGVRSVAAKITLFLIVLFLSLLITPHHAAAKRIVRAGIYNFKPLVYSDPSGAPEGFFVKMLDQVAQREGWEVHYVHSTWQGVMDNLKDGKIDLIVCVGYTEARAKFMDFPKEFLVLDWGVVYKAKGSGINTIMDLEGKTVACLKGSVYSAGFLDLVRQFQIKVNLVEVDQVTDVFQAVESGRAVAGITSNIPGILNEASHSVDRTPIMFTPVKLGFAVNKGSNGDLIEALDRNIAQMKGDQGSSYYHELDHLLGRKDSAIPKEVYWAFAGVLGVLLLAVSFIVTLRRKVTMKTAELKQQANLMESIINGTTDAVFIKDTEGRYIVVNDEVVRLFARPRSEILGRDDTHFFPQAEAEFLKSLDRAIMASHQVSTTEEHITTLDQPRVYLATKGPIYDKSGTLSGMFGISRDITELKQAITVRQQMEERLRLSNEQLQFVLEGSQLGSWDWNLETGEVACNERWAEMLGYTLGEVDGSVQAWASLLHPADHQRVWQAVDDHLDGRTALYQAEYRMLNKSKEYQWILDQGRVVQRDAEGRPLRMSGTHTDITERKRVEEERQSLEQQMHHAQRLESLGVLTGGIAHDFNNILAVILGHCCLAQMDAERAPASLAEIELAAERAADLCRQMLAYAGKAQFVQARLNFRELVDEMAKMLRPTISQKVTIKLDCAGEIPHIYGDASQLRQIVMNLVINASEAIGKEQGEIRLSVARAVIADGGGERDHLGQAIAPGAYLCLEVADNGCGMGEETRRRIFEPFYTTKFTGRGLGMSAVLGIIVAHNGALQFASEPGRGTTFKVYLPVKDGDGDLVDSPPREVEETPLWRSHGTVLLVEDEEQVRRIARSMLESFGFDVVEAVHGRQALELYRGRSSEMVLVLTDMGMPVMDGFELVTELRSLDPRLPIVVSSGFGDAEVGSKIAPEDIAGLISKPYTMGQLRDAVQGALATATAAP